MCRACPWMLRQASQRWVENGVDITPQRDVVDRWQWLPALDEFGSSGAAPWQWTQLGNRAPVACDDHALTALHPVQDFSSVVAEVAHSHRFHDFECITGETIELVPGIRAR